MRLLRPFSLPCVLHRSRRSVHSEEEIEDILAMFRAKKLEELANRYVRIRSSVRTI